MAEYIERDILREKVTKSEELARNRYFDTTFDSPAKARYREQMLERERFTQLLGDVPAADVAPVVHGRWENNNHGGIFCTACGKRPMFLLRTNYCPNCGAKMDLEGWPA